jgi:hypothetical protein
MGFSLVIEIKEIHWVVGAHYSLREGELQLGEGVCLRVRWKRRLQEGQRRNQARNDFLSRHFAKAVTFRFESHRTG